MDRPASRGGASGFAAGGISKAPTGSAMPVPDRPSTGMRGAASPGTAARPPSAQLRGGPAGPGAPPGTAYMRLSTAAQRPPGTAMRTAAPVQVDNRPITQHGVSGVKGAGGAGGGRQVLDKTYFVNELRQKRIELNNIIASLKVRTGRRRGPKRTKARARARMC